MAELKDSTINGNPVWHAGNDGTGSGLDADTLDGQHASSFYSASNPPPNLIPAFTKYTYNISSETNSVSGADSNGNTLTYPTDNTKQLEVFVNGVKLVIGAGNDYTATNGTSISFTFNIPAGSVVDVQVFSLISQTNLYTKTESDNRYINVSGDTMTGRLISSGGTTSLGGFEVNGYNLDTGNTNDNQGRVQLGVGRSFYGGSGAGYYHLILPSRYNNTNSKMFMLHIRGYDFDGGYPINIMIGGYVTPVNNGGPISRVAVWDAVGRFSPTAYYSSNYNCGVCRFYMPSWYYSTFNIDTICVGNGDQILPGEITMIRSTSSTI